MLQVGPAFTAQYAAETHYEQPDGHTVKLVALLAHSAVRYALWSAGQIPCPLSEMIQYLRESFDERAMTGDVIPAIQYGLEKLQIPVYQPRGLMRHAIAFARASVQLEQHLYSALRALQACPTETFRIAIVHGTSLHFARATWFWTFHRCIPKHSQSDSIDTPSCEAHRKKISLLLERKLARHCMMYSDQAISPLALCSTRILLYAPHTLRVNGWIPRPHWNPLIPADSDLNESESDSVDADMEVVQQEIIPAKIQHTTRMQLTSRALQSRRKPKQFKARTQRSSSQSHTRIDGGLCVDSIPFVRHVWFECDILLRGVSDFRSRD